jgi:peroxiredoxin
MQPGQHPMAPPLEIEEQWFNSTPLSLEALHGKVIVLGTFQMLCPGCVSTGLPQLQRVHDMFGKQDVVVVGLHSVFEHHAAMGPVSLEAFIHEYQLAFPIAIDRAGDGPTPQTMIAYGFRGTPSLVLIDRKGCLRLHHFGHVPDLQLGAAIQQLLGETATAVPPSGVEFDPGEVCPIGGSCG